MTESHAAGPVCAPTPKETFDSLGAVLIAVGLVMDSGIGLVAGTFASALKKRPTIRTWLLRTSAAIFGGLALRLMLTPRP